MIEHYLPPEPTRRAIADAVHAAVVERLDRIPGRPYDSRRFCWLYAAVGARIANAFVGKGYALHAGSVDFSVAGGPPLFESAAVPIAHHAWIERRLGRARVEVADLAARHYPFWFAEAGFPFPPGIAPAPVWAPPTGLPGRLLLRENPDAAAIVGAFQSKIGNIVEESVVIAFDRLVAGGFKSAGG